MPEYFIVEYLGRPLNDKEVLAKREVDGYLDDKLRDRVSRVSHGNNLIIKSDLGRPAYYRKNKRRRQRRQ